MTVKDFKTAIEKLLEFDDVFWGEDLLSRDPHFHKMDPETVKDLIRGALKCAEDVFHKCVGHTLPSDFAEHEKIKVKMDDAPLMEEYLYFGHYHRKPPTIEISEMAVEKVYAEIKHLAFPLDGVDLHQLVIAHELFHHFESQDTSLFTQKASVSIPRFRAFKRHYHVSRVSEIAAVHFSKLWLGLSFCPAVYDILLVHAVNPHRAWVLASERLQKGGR